MVQQQDRNGGTRMPPPDDADLPVPTRDEIDRLSGPVLLEFGAAWCGYCRTLAPHVAALLKEYPEVRHIKIEDGPGQPLGRSFHVTLWPTFVFLRAGQVLGQVARPSVAEIRTGLATVAGPRRT
jgi:thioredoxin 1